MNCEHLTFGLVKKILRDRNAQDPDNPVDFLMVVGDDISDEKMFTSSFSFLAEQGDHVNSTPVPPVMRDDGSTQESADTLMNTAIKIPSPQYSFTVAVGKKVSHASFYVNDASEVAKCLIQLAGGEYPEDGLHPWGNTTTEQMFS
jgi:trehalose 6-phosphate synthase/phosphatase